MTREPTVVILAVLLFLLPSMGHSQQDAPRTFYGAGTSSCQTWAANRKASSNDWYPAGNWVLGWVSAANLYAQVPPRKTDARSIAALVDEYCSTYQQKDISDAAQAIVAGLGTKW